MGGVEVVEMEMGKEEAGKYSESSETVDEGWKDRRESARRETGKEDVGLGVEE